MDDMNDNEAKKAIMGMLKELQNNMDSFHADIKELNTEMHTSFDSLDKKLDSIDGHFASMHTSFDSIDSNLDKISQLAEEEIQREKNRTAQYAEMLDKLKFPE